MQTKKFAPLVLSLLILISFVGCQSTTNQSSGIEFVASDSNENNLGIAISNLFSANFYRHAEGAASLVEAGEISIPFLIETISIERTVYGEKVGIIEPVLNKIFQELENTIVSKYLTHQDPILRVAAVNRLAETGESSFVPMISLLKNDPVPAVKEKALIALTTLNKSNS